MSNNLIYIVAIHDGSTKIPVNDYAKYSIITWEHYCQRHNIDLIVINENQNPEFDRPIWNKELIHKFGKKYEKIGIVDCDTMVRWDAPNIFDSMDPDKFYGVNDTADMNWLFQSIHDRQHFFPNVTLDIWKYINAGVLFFGKNHLHNFKELLEFWRRHKDEINSINGGGKEQTLLNFILQKNKVPIELLSPGWNLLSMHRKNMFTHNWQLHPEYKGIFTAQPDSWPHFIKYAYIWHFTGFPIEQRVHFMETTWNVLKEHYT